jgi:hypothetical protein
MKKNQSSWLIILFTFHNYNKKSQYGISGKKMFIGFAVPSFQIFAVKARILFLTMSYKIYFSNWAKLIFTIYNTEFQVRMKMRKGWFKVVQT